jgi:2-amino-4-hydroxy-6-hydroxymethyldihydropteridine diphosphokinase
MARVYLSIGSNVRPVSNVRSCLRALEATFGLLEVSTVYLTKAVGFEGDDFLNLAVGFESEMDAHAVAAQLRAIEAAHHRSRNTPKFSARTLDLDLLLYDDLVLNEEGLRLPRDEITRYAFVLCPLAEIAGARRHPQLGISYQELWEAFDKSEGQLQRIPFER